MKQNEHILIKNIFYMLSYAFTSLNQSYYKNVDKETFDNIHNMFATILSKGIGQQLKQGLHREYVDKSDNIPGLKGRLDIAGSLKNKAAKKQLLSCEFDELSENNIYNRIIKSTVLLLVGHKGVSKDIKNKLKNQMMFFSELDEIEIRAINWTKIKYQRNNQTYQMLLGVCRLIIDGMLMTTEKGEYKLAQFIDDQKMHQLYEKFIYEFIKKEFPQLNVNARHIEWAVDDDIRENLPEMKTDITLYPKNGYGEKNKILIIDAKYYGRSMQQQFDKYSLRSAHLYQIFTYVKNKEYQLKDVPHQVAGMLLYARTDEEILPDNDYQMSGNTISAKNLDLNTEFSYIESQIKSLVNNYYNFNKEK